MARQLTTLFLIYFIISASFSLLYAEEQNTEVTKANSGTNLEDLQRQIQELQKDIIRIKEEADVRSGLSATQAEKAEESDEILTAAGQDYTLMKEGALGIEYTFNYSFYSTDSLEVVKTNEVTSFNLDHISSHNLKNSIFFQYAFLDNVTFSLNIPFVYKWDKTSASNANNATDIGDLSLGARWQPFKSGDTTTKIINTSFTFPSGASPYKINTEDSLSTGSGLYSFSLGGSLSKTLDPILAFTSLYYGYSLPESGLRQHRTDSSGTRILTRVEPGDQISLSGGIGYALTYTLSVNISLQYSYTNNYTYHWVSQTGVSPKTSGIDSTSAALYLGTGWRISPKQSINVTAGIGLTNADPDFTLAFRIPFDFQL